MVQVVVLGAAFGGVPAACELREQPGAEHRMTAISNAASFVSDDRVLPAENRAVLVMVSSRASRSAASTR